jgi:hypothetical protein
MAVSVTESRFSVLALGMAVFMLGYTVWVGNRMPVQAVATVTAPGTAAAASVVGSGTVTGACLPYMAPRCAALCKMAMGVTMGYMLMLML